MTTPKTDILVYADWLSMSNPKLIGVLSAQQAKGRKAFSFEYDPAWLYSTEQRLLDPAINWYSGPQYSLGKENFGLFMDSMPDTWGRKLMQRREVYRAREEGRPVATLYDIDYLLGVNDETRMGALRFKLAADEPFLNNHLDMPVSPFASVRELQFAAEMIESDNNRQDVQKWLAMLMAPGSSLGGARPKANIRDEHGHLWIAKFPSKGDTIDKGAWEYVVYKLALQSGVSMAESKIEKVTGSFHTFFTKRFDRKDKARIHFASAMTMTGQTEDTIKENSPSYLDMADFIQFNGAQNKQDLQQLWRRIVFHIAVSNTDDHLRNHGFLLKDKGWQLSPAYDINPSVDKNGLALNIDAHDNALDVELAKSVGEYFQLMIPEMEVIISEVKAGVKNWQKQAQAIGISRNEQEIMEKAFKM